MLKRNPRLNLEGGGVNEFVGAAKKAGKKVRKAAAKAQPYVKKAVEIYENRDAIERKAHNTVAKVKQVGAEVKDVGQYYKGQAGREKDRLVKKWHKDPMSAVNRGIHLLHSHEHAIRVAEKLAPTAFAHLKHSASLVHEKMTGAGIAHDIMHRDHTVKDLHDFKFRYGKVPLGGLRDIIKCKTPL